MVPTSMTQVPPQQPQHNVMSPSLTSGFSGSGGDCKSTETSSILSAASYSSSNVVKGHTHGFSLPSSSTTPAGNANKSVCPPPYFCDPCHLAFPTQANLDSHLVSNRHSRRAKTLSLTSSSGKSRTQLQSGGVNPSGACQNGDGDMGKSSSSNTDGGVAANSGEIRCEVCQVSVNSSHQLQAHLAGNNDNNKSPLLILSNSYPGLLQPV